ncbi:MAG TPA: hypothetical protein VKV16_07490, partial [Solirubrobacteraceae bacterium]|nr:hypothetical protein [Solirubrobacteraceae bacterium]
MPRTFLALFAPLAAAALALAGCGGSTTQTATRAAAVTSASAKSAAFISRLSVATTLGSTVPGNGDVNPYGIALVASSAGRLRAGDVLVSNFNDKANEQGTGTTIDELTRAGRLTLFASVDAERLPGACPGGVGLTTALNVLPGGYVLVGSLPTSDGKSATAQAGCLIVLDSEGRPVETIAGKDIQGPWDSTAHTEGTRTTVFVSNALSGGAAAGVRTVANSTVLRLVLQSRAGRAPKVLGEQVVANGIPWRDSPEALVLGPTGLAL